jgi:hypothetical protein
MPETGGMLFPCTIKEEVPQQPRNREANENPEAIANSQQQSVRTDSNQVGITGEAKDLRKNPVKNFLEQSQSQRQLQQQHLKPAAPDAGGAGQKQNAKSVLSASVQNTPTLNIAWASQEGLRASAANVEASKIGEAQASAQADGSKQPEGRNSQDLRNVPQFTSSYQSQPKQQEMGLSNQALFGLGADHQQH